MLKIICYEDYLDLISTDLFSDNGKIKNILAPGPEMADAIRSFIEEHHQSNQDVLTIGNFIKKTLKKEKDAKVLRKADLFIEFSKLWRKTFNQSLSLFNNSYSLWSEIRGYSLNEEIIDEVIKDFDAEIILAVKCFNKWSKEYGLIDEHQAQFELSQHVDESGLKEMEFIFWGFHFLTGTQIDLVKNLSNYNDVYIPINSVVYENSDYLDWIQWIQEGTAQVERIGNKKDLKHLEVISYSKGSLSESLALNLNSAKESYKIYAASTTLDYNIAQEISLENLSYKISSEGQNTLLLKIKNELVYEFLATNKSLIDLSVLISNKYKNYSDKQKFREMIALNSLVQVFEKWRSDFHDEEPISTFDIEIMFSVAELNLPRSYFTKLCYEETRNSLKASGFYSFPNYNTKNVVIFSSNYKMAFSGAGKFSQESMQILATVSPVRNSAFEYELFRANLMQILNTNNSICFIEDGLLEFNSYVKQTLDKFDIQIAEAKLPIPKRALTISQQNVESHKIKELSSKKLQTYHDCPKKYYYSYIEKQNPYITLTSGLATFELGILEHLVIESYVKKFNFYERDDHLEMTNIVLQQHCEQGNHNLKKFNEISHKIEILNYSRSAIKFLLKFKELNPRFNIFFEDNFYVKDKQFIRKGSIDCYLSMDNMACVIDFKRSNSGVPSKAEFLNFDNFQLWFYLLNFPVDQDLCWGYFNLSEIQKSLFYTNSEKWIELLRPLGLKVEMFPTDLENSIEIFRSKINEIYHGINHPPYPARPRSSKVCHFCAVQNFCYRKEISENEVSNV